MTDHKAEAIAAYPSSFEEYVPYVTQLQRNAFIAGAEWMREQAARVAETKVLEVEIGMHQVQREGDLPEISRIHAQGGVRAAEWIRKIGENE